MGLVLRWGTRAKLAKYGFLEDVVFRLLLILSVLLVWALPACDGGTASGLDVQIDNNDPGNNDVNNDTPNNDTPNNGPASCGDVASGEVVEEGQLGECGDFADECAIKGTAQRTDQVCEDGQVVEVTVDVACERDTEGEVVAEGEFGECGDFADECDETGSQERTVTVCRDGAATEETEEAECERDTDGVVLAEGEFGECGDFDGECDETGTQVREDTVCVDGEAQAQEVEESCERDTDGVVVSEGEFGECGGFDGTCDETGTQSRTDVVCQDGAETEVALEQDCRRDTDDVVVSEGEFGECGGFDDACDEGGTQSRTDVICENGSEVDLLVSQACQRDTDGTIVSQGEPGECGNFASDCDETGLALRLDEVCRDGELVQEEAEEECERDTDGIVLAEGDFGPCGDFEGACDETGVQIRTDVVCEAGRAVNDDTSQACERDTDGVVVTEGEFGQCGGFENGCDETGVQERVRVVCADGAESPTTITQDCERDTEGLVINPGLFGQCTNEDDLCATNGTRSRQVSSCTGGQVVVETETENCQRNPEGQIVAGGEFNECSGFVDDCDPSGTQARFVTVCRGGQERSETDVQECVREPVDCVSDCGDEDDAFEPNQNFELASFIEPGITTAHLCRQNFFETNENDVYRFTVPPGADLDVIVRYDHNVVPFLGIVLYGPGGAEDPQGFLFPDIEDPNQDVLQDDRPLRVNEANAGEWFLEISGTAEGPNLDYEIELIVEFDEEPEDCGDLVDILEPNDSCETATFLPLDLDNCEPGTAGCSCSEQQTCAEPLTCINARCQMGFICGPAQDEDFFAVPVVAGQSLTIRLPHFHFEGNIDMEVYEPDFQTLAGFSFNAGPNFEEVTIESTQSGIYCVRVFALSRFTVNRYSVETIIE